MASHPLTQTGVVIQGHILMGVGLTWTLGQIMGSFPDLQKYSCTPTGARACMSDFCHMPLQVLLTNGTYIQIFIFHLTGKYTGV